MSISALRQDPTAVDVSFAGAALHVVLADGRELSVPLEWLPRLRDASPEQRAHWRLIGRGEGIHWPEVDEDVSVRGLLGLAS
jgi:Protein of unknown function (DUF2442)